MVIKIDEEKLKKRAENLKANEGIVYQEKLNGIDFILVDKDELALIIHFFNENHISDLSTETEDANLLFPITGGRRIPAGSAEDHVNIINIGRPPDTENVLKLSLNRFGDYSTYTLGIGETYEQFFDPLFAKIDFKFRPGCFNTQCEVRKEFIKAAEEPIINYLAKDFDTFKHTMIVAMGERVPGWEPTSEADLDLVLIELICAAADELSDFQDRVMNEAYLSTARKRVSLARHARLMDYHIFQGNQASTWLAVELECLSVVPNFYIPQQGFRLPADFQVLTPTDIDSPFSIIFYTPEESNFMHCLLNRLSLYTWNGTYLALKAGSTSADLCLQGIDSYSKAEQEDQYKFLEYLILEGEITHLLIQEWKDSEGRDLKDTGQKSNRQLLRLILEEELRLIPEKEPEIIWDPLGEKWCLRLYWDEKDQLKQDYNFTTKDNNIKDMSLFHANLVKISHGEFKEATFLDCDPDYTLANDEYFYERTNQWGIICKLPAYPLSYRDVYDGKPPTGQYQPMSRLIVHVNDEKWSERISLVNSRGTDRHFIVETDEYGQSLIRFGNDRNGEALPKKATVKCQYKVGIGQEGNLGADKLTIPRERTYNHLGNSFQIRSCWNPFDITNGRDPEPVEKIIRNVPEAYLAKQLRAITVNKLVDDYENRTQELEEISRARACYRWAGSWRIVQISVDLVGTIELSEFEKLHEKILRHVDAVRLIGDQIIVRQAKYIPLEIHVSICLHSDFWPRDVRDLIEDEFTDGYTPDGREAFFHPDCWSFGETVMKSQIIGRIQLIKGADKFLENAEVSIERWNEPSEYLDEELVIHPHEIIQVKNDPNQMEKGFIYFDLKGGRR